MTHGAILRCHYGPYYIIFRARMGREARPYCHAYVDESRDIRRMLGKAAAMLLRHSEHSYWSMAELRHTSLKIPIPYTSQ